MPGRHGKTAAVSGMQPADAIQENVFILKHVPESGLVAVRDVGAITRPANVDWL